MQYWSSEVCVSLSSVASVLLLHRSSDTYYSVTLFSALGIAAGSVIPVSDEESYPILAKDQVQGSTEMSYEGITNYKQFKPSYVVSAILHLFLDAG